MDQREVAKALGISRTWVQVLEYRALAKVAAFFGNPAAPRPRWLRPAWLRSKSEYRKTRAAKVFPR